MVKKHVFYCVLVIVLVVIISIALFAWGIKIDDSIKGRSYMFNFVFSKEGKGNENNITLNNFNIYYEFSNEKGRDIFYNK